MLTYKLIFPLYFPITDSRFSTSTVIYLPNTPLFIVTMVKKNSGLILYDCSIIVKLEFIHKNGMIDNEKDNDYYDHQ